MHEIDPSGSELGGLLEERLALLRNVAESLEFSSLSLVENDAQAIARGAEHQAELCRQWSCLEDRLRPHKGRVCLPAAALDEPAANADCARLQAEFELLSARIRYLTRVHCSLLRHLQRSLAILNRVVNSCAPTYGPDSEMFRTEVGLVAEQCAGE